MSTLVRNVSCLLLFAIFLGCLLLTTSTSCQVAVGSSQISGPFCSVEQLTSSWQSTETDTQAILVQKLILLFTVITSSILVLTIRPEIRWSYVATHALLVRFGPYQKRYPIMLPSFI